ncbi:MAG: crossover junction endodeoxyribonuclease RuvC [Pseudomonadota bacterium]
MKIVGIDPGSVHLGWGFIETQEGGSDIIRVDAGVLKAPAKLPFYERITRLGALLSERLQELDPDCAVIEKIFLGKSVDSAFKLGHIRGVCVAECLRQGAVVTEYAARKVKKQITGQGNAEKALVQSLLFRQLGLRVQAQSFDASDALALAFCHVLLDSVETKNRRMGLL